MLLLLSKLFPSIACWQESQYPCTHTHTQTRTHTRSSTVKGTRLTTRHSSNRLPNFLSGQVFFFSSLFHFFQQSIWVPLLSSFLLSSPPFSSPALHARHFCLSFKARQPTETTRLCQASNLLAAAWWSFFWVFLCNPAALRVGRPVYPPTPRPFCLQCESQRRTPCNRRITLSTPSPVGGAIRWPTCGRSGKNVTSSGSSLS